MHSSSYTTQNIQPFIKLPWQQLCIMTLSKLLLSAIVLLAGVASADPSGLEERGLPKSYGHGEKINECRHLVPGSYFCHGPKVFVCDAKDNAL